MPTEHQQQLVNRLQQLANYYTQNGIGNPDWKYPTYQHAVLDLGMFFDSQPRPKGVRKQPAKQCFQNAGRHIIQHSHLGTHNDIYIEGYADANVALHVHHAWTYNPDKQQMMDLTYVNKGYQERAYYGIPFTTEFMVHHWSTHQIWDVFSIHDYLIDGFPTEAIHTTI